MTILGRHISVRLLRSYAAVLVALGALVWLVELLERLSAAGGVPSRGLGEVMWMAFRLVPGNLIDLLPVVVLLATVLVMASLVQQSEMTVMRAAGISLGRMVRLALMPAVGIALLALATLQWFTPVLFQEAGRVAGSGLGETSLWHPAHGLWVRSGSVFLNVERMELGQFPADLSIHEFDDDGRLQRHISARRAVPDERGSWVLEEVRLRRFPESGGRRLETLEQFRWQPILTAAQLDLLRQPPASLPLTDLWRYFQGLRARDQEADEFEAVFWRRAVLPLACIGMAVLAVALAASPLKSRAVSLRVALAVSAGLAYQLLSSLASFFGLVADLPAAPVAVVPPLVIIAAGIGLLRRSR